MSSFTPQDTHNLILDFTDPVVSSNDLNFGDSKSSNTSTAIIQTQVKSIIHGKQLVEPEYKNKINAFINTSLLSFAHGEQTISYKRKLKAVINTKSRSKIHGKFDINFILGVCGYLNTKFSKSVKKHIFVAELWEKPTFIAHDHQLNFNKSSFFERKSYIVFDKTLSLQIDIDHVYEKAGSLNLNTLLKWQENKRIFTSGNIQFEESVHLRIAKTTAWVDLVRKRKEVSYSHDVAQVFEKRFNFEWDKGLEVFVRTDILWDKAKAIHYRKHPILPWPEKPIPIYKGLTILNFTSLMSKVDSHNVILNFGDDPIPSLPNSNWWHILNTLKVTRLDNGEEITIDNGSYNTDRSRWCWSYSLTVSESEISKLKPINGQPVILKIVLNNTEHHMLLEKRTRSRSFANITYTLTGRSQTALLDAPYSATRSFLQENERTSVQLVQAEIDRASGNPNLNWKLIDDLGWIVANQSLSYTNQSPISAIKMVAESGGGFVYSEKGSNTLSIKPQYKKTYWDSLVVDDYDRLIPESIVINQSTDFELYPKYNAITLTNDRSGATGQVKRTGTAGDVIFPSENNPLFNHVSMTAFGKIKLAKAGMVETHAFDMPIDSKIGECSPGEIFAFNAEWWGIIDSVSVSFNHSYVSQSVSVERVNNE